MTMKEIAWRTDAIHERRDIEFNFHAGIHGIDLTAKEKVDDSPMTDRQRDIVSRAMAEKFKRN